eukprot:5474846-Pleurochrysis_carterae.AAC.1
MATSEAVEVSSCWDPQLACLVHQRGLAFDAKLWCDSFSTTAVQRCGGVALHDESDQFSGAPSTLTRAIRVRSVISLDSLLLTKPGARRWRASRVRVCGKRRLLL